MKQITLKHVDEVTFANFVAVFSFIVTLVAVVVMVVLAWLKFIQVNVWFPDATFTWSYALWTIVISPFVALVTGWVWGAVAAWFYNVALGKTNGIKLEIDEK
ncbi:MAG: hypothetical protein WC437_02305 [Patescibacteria group bacterium]|jgi:glycopeptide antibiotics resistance protein|nr:hypothetical protein [Patescibacteria group bacterium]